MVFPKPTSSANTTPLEKGELKAKSAASIWWGLISTVELSNDWERESKSPLADWPLNKAAYYLAWYRVTEAIASDLGWFFYKEAANLGKEKGLNKSII